MVMMTVSKSRFKARALEYFREVERTGREIVVTDRGTPVVRILPYHVARGGALRSLRETVVHYREPLEPVGSDDWESSR